MRKHSPIVQKGWYLSFNPFSIAEPGQGGVGIGVENRISKHFEARTELNYLYHGKLSPNAKFEFEVNAGAGAKQRSINRKNVPTGYDRMVYDFRTHYQLPDHNIEETLIYIPGNGQVNLSPVT
ncbi:MAG TPA: hypothetical protein VK489_02350 [Ferruginibacter sp.]|nr:hypothetical protein [Ferruginibacter sp.]